MQGKGALKFCKLCAKINEKSAKTVKKCVTFCCVYSFTLFFSLIKLINNFVFYDVLLSGSKYKLI